MGGRTYSPDDTARFDMAASIVKRGSIEIPPSPCASAETNDGRIYAKSGIGKSLLIAPFFVAGRALERAGAAPGIITAPMFASLLDQLLAAAAVALLFAAARGLGFSVRRATLIAGVFGAATMLWPMSKFAFEHSLIAVLLLAAFIALGRFRDRGLARDAATAGACLGAALLVRVSDFSLAAPGLAAYALVRLRRSPRPAVAFAALALPIFAAAAGVLAYNFVRFDDFFENGYDDLDIGIVFLPKGLLGLLASPGKSVFLWNLPLVAALFAWRAHWSRHRAEAILTASMALAYLFASASFRNWHGDWCVGPRYLFPVVPFLLLALGDGLAAPESRRRVGIALAAAIPLGVVIQLVGVSIDYWPYFERFRNDVDGRNFTLAKTQLVVYWEYILDGRFDFFWARVIQRDASPIWLKLAIVLPIAGVVAGVRGVMKALRAEATLAHDDAPADGSASESTATPMESSASALRASTRIPRAAAAVAVAALVAIVAARAISNDRARDARAAVSATAEHGLSARYFANTNCAGEPVIERVDRNLCFDWRGARRPIDGEFSVEWDGTLNVPASGAYKFFLRSRDGSWLSIDDSLFIDNGGLHGVRQIARSIALDAGPHRIRLRAFDSDFGEAELRLAWKPKGALFHAVVGGTALSPAVSASDAR
ncbi:MAG: PA14 domain-containing protein [bacterium]